MGSYIGVPPYGQTVRSLSSYTATAGQTTFYPTGGYTVAYLDVYLNGLRQVSGTDYTATDGLSIVFTDPLIVNDVVEIVVYGTISFADSVRRSGDTLTGTYYTQDLIPSANNTYNLGSATARFNDIYLSNSSIYIGDSVVISANATNLIIANTSGGALSLSNTSFPNTGVTAGTYGNSSAIPVLTVDSTGRVTGATTNAVAGVTGFTYTTANATFTITTGAGTSYLATIAANSITTAMLTDSGVTAGAYGNTTAIPVITVDAKGRVTAMSTSSVSGVTGLTWTGANNTLTVATSTTNYTANLNSWTNPVTFSNTVAAGNTSITGSVTVSTTAGITGAATFSNTIGVTGAATFSNTVGVTGAATFSNTIAVTGTSNFTGLITGTITSANNADYLDGQHGSYYAANTLLANYAPLAGATFTGPVSGVTTMAAGNTTVTGYANVTSSIQVGGAATVGTTLAAGNTTITGFANVTGSAQVGTTLAAGNTTITGFANVTGTLQIGGQATIGGNLVVNGTTITVNTSQINVTDSLMYLASNNEVSDSLDIGFAAHYNNGAGANGHTGFIRSAITKKYYLFQNYQPEFFANNNVDVSNTATGIQMADLVVGNLVANSTLTVTGAATFSNTMSVTGLITGTITSANNADYLDGQHGTYYSGLSSTAYSNAIAIAANATNLTSGTVAPARLPQANTTANGAVIFLDSVANTSTSIYAPTMNAVKTAYDAAITANTNAATASSKADAAYTNAVAYAASNTYVNTQLGLKANLSGATFTGAVSGITTLAAGNTTISGQIVSRRDGADASSNTGLGLDINSAWIRIGDGQSGTLAMANGVGIKLHDSGNFHGSFGVIGTTFYISETSGNGEALWPSTGKTDYITANSSLVKLYMPTTVNSTLAAGNTTITGFANVSSTLQVGGNIKAESNVVIRYSGGSGELATPYAALTVNGPGASANIHYDEETTLSTVMIRGNADNVNLQLGTGAGYYNYAGWIQASYDNVGTTGAEPLLLNPSGGNIGINTGNTAVTYPLTVNGAVYFAGNTTVAGHVLPSANNSYDLGSSAMVWRHMYTGDLFLSNEGHENGNDVDGTKGKWVVQEGAENLYIINRNTGKKYKFELKEVE